MNNIFHLLILGLAGGLIFMDLFIKINLDDTLFSKNSKVVFILLFMFYASKIYIELHPKSA